MPGERKIVIDIGGRIDELDKALNEAKRRSRATIDQINNAASLGISAGGGSSSFTSFLGINARGPLFEATQARSSSSIERERRELVKEFNVQQQIKEIRRERDRMKREQADSVDMFGRFDLSQRSRNLIDAPDKKKFSLEGFTKTAGLTAAGIEAAAIATKAWNGDLQGAADIIKSLPYGIGHIARSIESLIGDWTGINREIEYYNRYADAAQKQTALIRAEAERWRMVMRQIREEADKIRSGASSRNTAREQGGTVGSLEQLESDRAARQRNRQQEFDDEKLRLRAERDEKNKIARELAETVKKPITDRLNSKFSVFEDKEAALADLKKIEGARNADLQVNENVMQNKLRDLRKKYADLGLADAKDYTSQRADLEKRFTEEAIEQQARVNSIEDASHEARLRASGQEKEADLAASRAKYQNLISSAKSPEEQAALENLRDSDLTRIERDAVRREREHEYEMQQQAKERAESLIKERVGAIEGQRLNPTEVSAQYSGIKEDKTSRIQEQQLKVQEESARILKDMLSEAQKKQDFINAGFDG